MKEEKTAETEVNGDSVEPKKKKVRPFSIVSSAILVLAVLLCLTVTIQVGTKGYFSIGGFSVFRVITNSMEPTMPVGTVLVSQDVDINDVCLDDIICFRSKESVIFGQVVTHRVVGIETNEDGSLSLVTRGDHNTAQDGFYVTESNLVGRVIWYTGDGSVLANIIALLTSKIGFMALIVVPLLVFCGLFLKEKVKSLTGELAKMQSQLEPADDSGKASAVSEEEYKELYEKVKNELNQTAKEENKTIGQEDKTER